VIKCRLFYSEKRRDYKDEVNKDQGSIAMSSSIDKIILREMYVYYAAKILLLGQEATYTALDKRIV